MRLSLRAAVAFVAVLSGAAATAAGCGRAPIPGAPPESDFDRRAAEIAPLWHGKKDGFIPLQGLMIPPRDGFPDDKTKLAFDAGWYSSRVPLENKGEKGAIEFPDGTKTETDPLSADAAFRAMDRGEPGCPQCFSLEVTGAQLGKGQLRTSRGVATVPVWWFTVDKVSAPVGRVAVPPEAITPLPTPSVPAPSRNTPQPLVSAESLVAVNGSEIDFRLGVGACDNDIKALVWEDAEVVVIGGTVVRSDRPCTMQLLLHPVKVTTASPVGSKLIVDALTGAPVTLR